jgi:PAS domain S-box-containing protein
VAPGCANLAKNFRGAFPILEYTFCKRRLAPRFLEGGPKPGRWTARFFSYNRHRLRVQLPLPANRSLALPEYCGHYMSDTDSRKRIALRDAFCGVVTRTRRFLGLGNSSSVPSSARGHSPHAGASHLKVFSSALMFVGVPAARASRFPTPHWPYFPTWRPVVPGWASPNSKSHGFRSPRLAKRVTPAERRCFRAVLACALVLAMLLLAMGPGPVAASTIHFTHLSVEQGMSQSTVNAILQDRAGFLWFGTEEGLDRYDGYAFVAFKHDARDSKSILDDVVTALFEDGQHRLWVGTEHGLCFFDRQTETFTRIPSILDRVTSITESSDGTLWVAVEAGGLFLRNPATGAFASYQPDANNPASLASLRVSALLHDRSGRLWIGSRDGGVDLFQPSGRFARFIHHRHDARDPASLADDNVWSLAEDAAGNLWIATYGGGLDRLDHQTGIFHHHRHRPGNPHSLPTDLVTCVFVDRAGTIWAGTDRGGVQQYDPASDGFVALVNDAADPASLSQNVVRSIYEDVQGQLWVGTFLGGANLLKKPRRDFGYFTHDPLHPSSLSDPAVACFLEDAEGHIWLGTEGGWLNRLEQPTGRFVRYRFPSALPGGSAILSLHQDRRGRIWVGSYEGGLARFDPRRGSFVVYKHHSHDPKSLSNDEVWAIAEDDAGALWLANNAGVDRFDPDLGAVTTHLDTLTADGQAVVGARALLYDRRGDLWVGSVNGGLKLLRHGSNSFIRYLHDEGDPHSLSHDSAVALYEDRAGRIWVGTLGGGLNLVNPATGLFTAYKEFPSNVIHGIEEEPSGRLWLSTNHGLARFDPGTGTVESFDLSNGLQSLQFHPGASLRTQSGRLLFGSIDGFYNFVPESIRPDTYAPPVVLTSIRIVNEPAPLPKALSAVDEIKVAPGNKIFSFEFAALDYTVPRHNRYAYLMQGFNDKWIDLGSKRDVTFTNLDPGTYTFRVKASNSDGVWSEKSAAALRVIVLPPFWRTWWFRGLSAAVFTLVLLTAHRVRVRRLTADIAEKERTQDALRASDERYRAFVSSSSEAIWRFEIEEPIPVNLSEDRQIDLIFEHAYLAECNDAMARMYGFARAEQFVGRPVRDFFVRSESNVEFLRSFIRAGYRMEDGESHEQDRNGKWKYFLNNHFAIIQEGQLVRFWGAQRDITDQKRLEEQLRQSQKMEAIGTLSGGIAHDFNNLLTVIKGYSSMVLDRAQDKELRAQVERIDQAAEQAASLTRQLLAFSRRQLLQPKVFNVNTLVLNLDRMLRRLIGEDIEMVTVTAPDIGSVKADPGQLEQVIMNLVVNARDAMPRGGKLTLETASVDLDQAYALEHAEVSPGRYILLAVSDTGVGMNSEEQAHIFEPFFTTKQPGKGTGLGLSMVYGIVKQSGGSISVYSEPGRGSTFKIYLPGVDTSAEDLTVEQSSSARMRGNETILLVEDDPLVRELARAVLTTCGYSVLVGEDPRTVASLCERHPGPIHLLITDVVMPGASGREVASQVLARRPGIKVLFMSGYTADAVVHHGVLDGGTLFLPKPFTPSSLANKVREVLDQTLATKKPD